MGSQLKMKNKNNFQNEIEQSYLKGLKTYNTNASQQSIHWLKNFNDGRKFLYENLENFRNNRLSDGLDDKYSPLEQRDIFIQLLLENGIDFVFKNLLNNNIGHSKDIFKVGEKYIDASKNFHIKWLSILERHIFSKSPTNVICEIGGGYGSLAEKILTNHKCTYILIDLPETNFMSSYYLSQSLPEKKILFYSDLNKDKLSLEKIDAFDIIIVPPWVVFDENVKIDLFINTRSMMEMNHKTIESYFDLIQKHLNFGGFFFNINRYYKDTVGYPIKLSEYPYDQNWLVKLSESSWRQEWIHLLITQRTSEISSEIEGELARIQELSIPFCNPDSYKTIWPSYTKKMMFKTLNILCLGIPKLGLKLAIKIARKIGYI